MTYQLNNAKTDAKSAGFGALKRLGPPLRGEGKSIAVALIAILLNAGATLLGPILIGYTVDTFIRHHDFHGVLVFALILLGIYAVGSLANYIQIIVMGGVGRRMLYRLRNDIFNKLQELPVAFFNQNKAGDLISRINNDTDRLNQFFAQALMQFIGSLFLMLGACIFLLTLNIKLGVATLLPAVGVFIATQLISGWVKRKNLESLQTLGGMTSEIQESLNNFKVIVAFNRLDYFKKKFDETNQANFSASVRAGYANNVFIPIYGLASNLAQVIVIGYGIMLITGGQLTVGLLIGFLLYVNNFYQPLRQLAAVWASFQQALAALDRISDVMNMHSEMKTIRAKKTTTDTEVKLEFHNVHFSYPEGKEVLKGISFKLLAGKTYALVGPTGGGKTTTASLMARLYDPTEGTVLFDGLDFRSYPANVRTKRIGFILQEPFLFTGSVLDNLFYGNDEFVNASKEKKLAELEQSGLSDLLKNFENGLDTVITTGSDTISLGQRQLIAFVRAVLRKPEVLILDEATANIDTVTEQLLEAVLEKLPASTTKVVIAHRLNTIANADEIFFVNDGAVTAAGSLDHAVEMLMKGKRTS